MSKSTNGLRKAGIASIATTLVLGAGFAGAGSASALPGFDFQRLAGEDRYATAADIADQFAAAQGDVANVILASGQDDRFPDALSANYLAGELNAPILLTRLNTTPASTMAALERLGTDVNITVVGGEGVISEEQLDTLRAEGYTVERVAGPLRWDTNADVIEEGGASTDGLGIVASGLRFPDALASGPLAYAEGMPLGLTKFDDVPQVVIDALKAANVDRVVIVGGVGVVSPAVEADLAAADIEVVERLAGANRDDTAAEVARYAVENFEFSMAEVNVASGYNDGDGADALAGGPFSGETNTPMLITRSEFNAGDGTLGYLSEHCSTLTDGWIFGGEGAVQEQVELAMEEAAQSCGAPSNQDFTVTPAEAATNEVSTSGTTNEGARQYSISGLDNATTYDVALFDAADVSSDDNGVVSFADDDNNNQADLAVDANGAVIEVVNGAAIGTPDNHIEVQPVNGTISFTVDSTSVDNVYPVLWVDATPGAANAINLDANDQPTELFGVGGQKRYVAAEAGQGNPAADVAITDVDKDANVIYSAGARYEYDANDNYYVRGTDTDDANATATTEAERVTFAEFEAQLSAGDELDMSTFYQPNAELPSTFVLEDIAPAAPTAAAEDVNDTNVSFTVSGIASGATVTVYGGPDDDNAFNRTTDVQRGQTTTDQDPNTTGFQVIATGLSPETAYDFFITQTVAGEESSPSTRIDETTTAPADPAIINNAELVTDAPIVDRVGAGDEWLVEFDQDLTAGTVVGSTFDLRDPDGDVIRVVCEGTDPTVALINDGDFLTEAACVLADGADTNTAVGDALEITLISQAEDRNAGGDFGTAGGGIQYPLTITAVNGLADAENEDIDVANSTDVLIDDEA